MRSSIKAVVAGVVAAGAVAGVSHAAISNNGVVTMCVNNATGAVRAVDPTGTARPCANTETVLPMNQTGPAGPAGPAGPVGPAGPATLPTVQAKWLSGAWGPSTSLSTVMKIDGLGKGAYHVTAKGTAFEYEALGVEMWAAVTCQLRVRHADGQWEVMDTAIVEVSDNGPEYASFALQGVMRVNTATTESARLDCMDDGELGGDFVVLRHVNLHVTPIGNYVQSQA